MYGSQYGSQHGRAFSQPNTAPSSDFDELLYSQPGSSLAPHQEASQSSRRPQCPECGTRKMRLRAGQLICKRGHVQQHFRIEQAEDDEFLGDGVARKRRTVTVNKVRRAKSQHTPYFSQPETDVEPEDSEEDQLEEETRRAHKRARRQSSRSRYSPHSDEVDELVTESQEANQDNDAPPSIRADSFFERPPRPSRSNAASSAAEESGMDSEPDTYARASRRGIRRIWRSGVGLHGAYEGRFALLQCLQLILRLQLQKLREIWGDKMPQETEAVARDLWTMFVSLLPVGHYPPEPLIAATFDWHTRYSLSQERAAELFPNHATYDPESDIRHHRRRTLFNGYHHHLERKRSTADPQKTRTGEHPHSDEEEHADSDDPAAAKDCIDWIVSQDEQHQRSRSQRSSEPETLADPEDELAELDPVFAEERRQQRRSQAAASETGSANDEEGGSDLDLPPGQQTRRKRRRHIPSWATKHSVAKAQAEVLHLAMVPTTISIIYLSLHLLKIPVFWIDLVKLISSYKLPYLNVVHQLPLPLTQFLNKDNVHHHHLDTDLVPSITTLHLHTLSVADLLQRTYGVEFGQGNVSGQLARLVEGMLLPPTFYVATKRLLDMLDRGVGPEPMPSPPQMGSSGNRRAKGDKDSRAPLPGAAQVQRVPKEFVLMAALLVVVKMRYGLDGRDRIESSPENEKSGVSCAPLLEPWLSALDKRRERYMDSLESVAEMDPAELDALYMTSAQVEAYAAFAEENLVLSNQIDLHEWRRLEPQRRWAAFTDFIPASSSTSKLDHLTQASRHANGSHTDPQNEWKDLETDLHSIYRNHIAPPSNSLSTMEPGSAYPMHQFVGTSRSDADPLGLAYSPLYPRVVHHANHLVGIATPPTASRAMDAIINAMVNPRAENADASVKVWESAYGIQAHLEVVERMLEAEVKGRAGRMRSVLRRVQREKVGEGSGGKGKRRRGESEGGAEDGSDDDEDEETSDTESEEEGESSDEEV
ncbi:conserved hypothetical protein [Sporisorium reilianum SRZ2]|uniref:Uncharacterized protein n=1 Tax=Sporisorium reilianum (strain SRZ2) TaxID=999809 RepID=E6ZTC8_SPORE|nr:conserved hypothetical protein [Sporisorium reilianum SRZ2]